MWGHDHCRVVFPYADFKCDQYFRDGHEAIELAVVEGDILDQLPAPKLCGPSSVRSTDYAHILSATSLMVEMEQSLEESGSSDKTIFMMLFSLLKEDTLRRTMPRRLDYRDTDDNDSVLPMQSVYDISQSNL